MRVALVAPLVSAIREPQRGGSQAFISDLARGLVVRGHDVELYCASGSEVPGVRVIETDVDPDALAASLYRASAPAPGAGAVFAVGFSPEKGALEAIEIARAAGVAIELYGDPYDPDYARERIEPRRDDPGVDVRPGVPRTEIWEVMARAAVLLCPAMWEEPFGMAAAEAQSCGTPVVAFRSGALGEVILDRVTGFLVTPGDLGAAAQAVHSAASLSRSRCREHAERDLDLALSLDAHERLYERVVRGRVEVATGG